MYLFNGANQILEQIGFTLYHVTKNLGRVPRKIVVGEAQRDILYGFFREARELGKRGENPLLKKWGDYCHIYQIEFSKIQGIRIELSPI